MDPSNSASPKAKMPPSDSDHSVTGTVRSSGYPLDRAVQCLTTHGADK